MLLWKDAGRRISFARPWDRLNAVDSGGRSAFHPACRRGHLGVVQFLVALPGFNLVNAEDNNGGTGLHHAVISGNLFLVRYLLSSSLGFDAEARNSDGWSALHFACACGHLNIVEHLLTAQSVDVLAVTDNGKSCLYFAVQTGKVEIVRYLLENYPDAEFVAMTDGDGDTPLHAFYRPDNNDFGQDRLETARLLLENGANINARNNNDQSPLHVVALQDSRALAQEYVQHGADLLAVDDDGDTPYDLAEDEVAYYILTEAYKDQVFEDEGNRAIHAILEAAVYRDLVEEDGMDEEEEDDDEEELCPVELPVGKLTFDEFRDLLLSFDGNLMRQQDNTGATPFHFACGTAAPVEILEPLLAMSPGALNIADNSGALPIHCACQAESPSLAVLRFLSEQDPASVRALDNAGYLPLHHLCGAKPPEDCVKLLVAEYEGSPSVRANNGDLPFTVACKTRASPGVCSILLTAYPDALEGYYNPK